MNKIYFTDCLEKEQFEEWSTDAEQWWKSFYWAPDILCTVYALLLTLAFHVNM